jgi:predicted alpha-1,2-mannosidase
VPSSVHRRVSATLVLALAASVALAVPGVATAPVVSAAPAAITDYTALVDPFVSTQGDDGNDLPGAQAPNGLAKVNPLTTPNRNHSGYDYAEDQIAGFTQTNLDGVGGSGGGGDILVVPTQVEYTARPGTGSYAHTFSHQDEAAEPGYYRVGLADIAGTADAVTETGGTIDAEVTATTRTAVHRYAFPDGSTPSLVVDLANNFTGRTASSVQVGSLSDGRATLSGQVAGSFNGYPYRLAYYAETTAPVVRVRTWGDSSALTGATAQDGTDTGAILSFDPASAGDLGLRITISPISADQARTDQANEVAGLSFDDVREQTHQAWQQKLATVDVAASLTSDPDGELERLFYTHLYRMFALPVNATSTEGTYRGVDGAVHQVDDFTYYDGWSSWDDFRKYSVLAYVAPEQYRDLVQSLIVLFADTAQSGQALGSLTQSVPTVRWERSAVIIADALSKGYTGFDRLDEAWPALRDYTGYYTGEQLRQGYVSNDPGTSVQRGYDDWALSIIADALGRTDDAATLRAQASMPIDTLIQPGAWTAADGTAVGLLTPRDSSGTWGAVDHERFEAASLYQGTLWQYHWYDAYDMDGLIEAMGGTEAARLAVHHLFGEDGPDDGSGMLHSNANEIDLQAPYLFNYVGEPAQTQKWVRAIYTGETWNRYIATGSTNELPSSGGELTPPVKTKVYDLDPSGFLPTMDNDAGTMSTMFVAAALGLFPVTAGSSQFQIGTPFFDSATLHYAGGTSFTVSADGVSPESYYVQSATLNGQPFANTWLDYADVLAGGSLAFTMGSAPSTWGADTAPAYSLSTAGDGTTPGTVEVTASTGTVEAAVDGSVDANVTLTLPEGSGFAGAPGSSLVQQGTAAVDGLPDGVTADVVATGARSVSVRLGGRTDSNAKFAVAFTDGAFTNGLTAGQVTGQGVSGRSPLALSVASADRVALQQLVDEAVLVRQGSYSYASYQAFLGALQRAQTAVADPAASSARLRGARDTLQAAADALALDEGAYRTLQAEQPDEWSGGQLKKEAYNSDGNLGGVTDGAWTRYNGLDFAGVAPVRVDVRYSSSASTSASPSTVELHAGGIDGPVAATVSLPGTGSWQAYTTVSAAITDPQALMAAQQITFVFRAPSGQQWVSNFDWFQLFSTVEDAGDEVSVALLTASNVTETGAGEKPLNLNGGKFENVTDGAWARWSDVDLGDGADTLVVTYDKPSGRAASDSHIELRLGAPDGDTVVDVPLAYTGSGWGTTGTATATLDPAVFAGVQDVYALFLASTQSDAQPYVANVTSLELTHSPRTDVVLQAADWVANSGGGLKKETGNWNDGTTVTTLAGTTTGAWLDYGDLDFGAEPRTRVSVHYVNNSSRCGADSAIQLYLDGFDAANPGTPYATVPLPATGTSWTSAGTTTVDLPAITGTHRVHLRLVTTPDASHPYVANIDALTFLADQPGSGNGPVDLGGLSAAVDEVAGLAADGARYGAIDFAVFTRELAAARAMLATAPATQEEVDRQARSLRLSAGQLVPRVRLVLIRLVDRAAAVTDERYTEASWSALRSALGRAHQVLALDGATDAQVSAASDALSSALTGLVVRDAVVPAAPGAVSATVDGTSITVEWTSPADDGGSALTGFVVVLDDDHRVRIEDPSQRAVTFALLPTGTTYRAHVVAVNRVGDSAASAPTVAVTTGAASLVESADVTPAALAVDGTALAAGYASDSWPTTPTGESMFVYLLRGERSLGTDVLAANSTLPDTEAVTAENDAIAVSINTAASAAQVDRAEYDADNGAAVTMADGLGSRLGPLYLTALQSGQLPETDALLGRVTSGLDDVESAKSSYQYLRPYVRLGFVGEGGKIRESTNGSYSGLTSSGSFPSGHTYGGYTAGTVLATLLPELSSGILARTSEYGDNRIVLGFHYPLDVMGGRMVAQATIAHRWADPEFAPLLESAHQEIERVLLAACRAAGYGDTLTECQGDPYDGLDESAAVDRYTSRLSYGFSQVGEAGQPIAVPEEAAALLSTAFPDLTAAQRTQVLEQTALDSGYPLDLTAEGDASWQRLDLAAAMSAQVVVGADGNVTVTNGTDATRASMTTAGSIQVDGTAVDGFSPATRTYVVDRAVEAGAPELAAVPSAQGATVTATAGSGTATVPGSTEASTFTVTSANGLFQREYTVLVNRVAAAAPVDPTDPGATPGDGATDPGVGSGSGGSGSGGSAAGGASSSRGGSLAVTGAEIGWLVLLTVLLIAGGATAAGVARRRRRG